MTTRYLWSGATGAANGTSWTDAYTSMSAANTASSDGDIIKVHKTHQDQTSAGTLSFKELSIVCVDKDSSDAPATMGTGGWLGNSSAATNCYWGGAKKVTFRGITFRYAGTTSYANFVTTLKGHFHLLDCDIWYSDTSGTGSLLSIGASWGTYFRAKNLKLNIDQTGNNSLSIVFGGRVEINNLILDMTGRSVALVDGTYSYPGEVTIINSDLSKAYATLVANANDSLTVRFHNCIMPTNFVLLAAQTTFPNKSGTTVSLSDCAVGDTHVNAGYADAFGSVVSDTATYFTAGLAGQSWKITTTSYCSADNPFITPWIAFYQASGGGAITPYLEMLRNDGSASARTDVEVWGEFSGKETSGYVIGTTKDDRAAWLASGTAQAAGAGTGSWTIASSSSPYSYKIDSSSSMTLAENGELYARALVGAASITAYLDPQVRT